MAERPNVVVFFTDQQRWDASSLHGNPLDLMPNFERAARRGTHVRYSFTCQPVCGPARSCLQTGQYATTTGVYTNGFPLKDDAVTLAHCFREAGYRTGYIGKWHLGGRGVEPVPEERRGGYEDWLASNTLEFTSDAYQTTMYDTDNNPVDLPGYRVDAVTDAAIRYIDAHKDNPFFLFLSYIEPHHQNHIDDYPPPDGYRERYAGRWTPPDLQALGGSSAQHLAGYWGMIKRLDEAYGRMLDALKSLGLDENTIVLFTSDHGCHFKTRNSEYKRSCHDSSTRVPTMFAGPGFEGGGGVSELVSLVDLPPTLLDAAGLDAPDTMAGRSIMPLLRGERADWPDDVFVQISEAQCGRAIRTKRWKYCVDAPEPWDKHRGADQYVEQYLYDLKADPYELNNLVHAQSHENVRQVMRERLLRRMKEVGEPEPQIVPAEVHGSGQRSVSEKEARQ